MSKNPVLSGALKVIKGIIDVITTLMVFVFVSAAAAVLILNLMHISPRIVVSGSMEPTIHTGSLCFINANVPYDDIEVGDIVAFQAKSGSLVTHRVTKITPEGMETKGDNNDAGDGLTTTRKSYQGKNVFAIPYLGFVIAWAQVKKHRIIIICGAGALILLEALLSSLEKDKKEKAVEAKSLEDDGPGDKEKPDEAKEPVETVEKAEESPEENPETPTTEADDSKEKDAADEEAGEDAIPNDTKSELKAKAEPGSDFAGASTSSGFGDDEFLAMMKSKKH